VAPVQARMNARPDPFFPREEREVRGYPSPAPLPLLRTQNV
jgi:hypothetical protein